MVALDGVIPSPNIWNAPDVYELENRGVDPDGVIESAMSRIRDWDGAVLLDVGCGTGFHLPRFATRAARVIGVEPHPPLRALAARRIRAAAGPGSPGRGRIEVLAGTAQALPVPDASVDVVHARWAYFFGPGCEPGLREVDRVLRRGGAAFVIDNDATASTFGRWFRQALPDYDPVAVERFWALRGWQRTALQIRWEQPSRAAFEAVVRIEFRPEQAEQILAEHPGCSVDHAVNLWSKPSR